MSLKIIYGRAKSHKGDTVFKEAVNNSGLIIVPEAFTLYAEQKLSKLTGTLGLNGPEVLSFERLAHSFSEKAPLSKGSIAPSGKSIAIALIAQNHKNELSVLKSCAEHPGFSKEMLELICECKRYQVSPEDLYSVSEKTDRRILSSKIRDIALIYEKYNEFLSTGYTDKDDDINRLQLYLKEKTPLYKRHIYIDRFDRFSKSELAVIKELIIQCASVTITLPAEPKSFEFQFTCALDTADKLKDIAAEAGADIFEEILPSAYDNAELSHLEKNYFSFEHIKYQDKPVNISLFSAKSISSEAEAVARKIRKLVMDCGLKYSDFSVIVRDTSLYSSAVKSVFDSFSIPYTDTETLSSSVHPLSIYVSSITDVVTTSFSTEPLFRFLKSGFSPCKKEDSDKLENYMLAAGISGSAFLSDEKWTYRTSVYSDYAPSDKENDLINEIDAIRRTLLPPFIALKEKFKGKITATAFCKAIYDFFEETNLIKTVNFLLEKYEKEGRNDEAARLVSVYNSLIDTFDALIASSGDVLLSAKKFNSIFTEGIAAGNMRIIPSSSDCVNFINAIRAKGTSSPIVFIMGLNDNVFPKTSDKNGILSDADRMFLSSENIELSSGAEFRNYEELALLYSALTIAESQLYLSYSLHNESGKNISPSQVIGKIKEIFPEITEESDAWSLSPEKLISAPSPTLTHMLDALNRNALGEDIDEVWLKVYDWFLKNRKEWLPSIPNSLYEMQKTAPLSKENIALLFPEDATSGVSKLEAYSSCPFKYFMRYIMHAEKRKIAEFSPRDTGSILHRYVDSASRYIESNALSWQKITEEELKSIASKVTGEIIENSSYFVKNSKRYLYLIKRLQNLSQKMLSVIKNHYTSGRFEPMGSEIVFGKGGDYPEIKIETKEGAVNLTGKIDRADVLHTDKGDFVRIIDYKSGSKTFSLSEVYHGLNLQLSLYMLALNNHTESKPAAMLYFRLDDPIESLDGKNYDKAIINGITLSDDEIISAMGTDELKASGDFKTSYATLENFDTLFSHVRKTVEELYASMKSGAFPVNPKSTSADSPCAYCDYSAVCASSDKCTVLTGFGSKNPWSCFEETDKTNDTEVI